MALRDWRWPQWTILISLILLVAGLGVLVYMLSVPTAFVPPTPEQPTPIGGLPTPIPGAPTLPPSDIERVPLSQIQGTDLPRGVDLVAQGDVTQIDSVSLFPTRFTALAASGNEINFYDPEVSRFYRISDTGVITKIGEQVFAEVQDVAWADNAADAILEFPDSSNIRYNFDTNEQVTLPSHWDEFDFSPASTSLAFKSNALDPEERWLAISDANGGNTRRIEHLGEEGDIVDVDWSPNNQVVATYTRPDGLSRSELFFLGFNGERFPLSRLNGLNFEGRWAPGGRQMLYSVAEQANGFKPRLWVVDGSGTAMGGNRVPFALETWPHKCAFASATVAYCGVPTQLPDGAGLIPSVADNIADDLYRVDFAAGTSSRLAIPNTPINVGAAQVSADGKTLFIQDTFTGTIKKVQVQN